MEEIELGDKVKDIVTGYVGIAVAKTTFLNGCIQFSIAEQTKKKPDVTGDPSIDSSSLIIIEKGYVNKIKKPKKKEKKELHGGATKYFLGGEGKYSVRKMRGF